MLSKDSIMWNKYIIPSVLYNNYGGVVLKKLGLCEESGGKKNLVNLLRLCEIFGTPWRSRNSVKIGRLGFLEHVSHARP